MSVLHVIIYGDYANKMYCVDYSFRGVGRRRAILALYPFLYAKLTGCWLQLHIHPTGAKVVLIFLSNRKKAYFPKVKLFL